MRGPLRSTCARQGFDDDAEAGREFVGAPTPLLAKLIKKGRDDDAKAYAVALAGVAVEACSLDPDPSLKSINLAGRVARAQLAAAGAVPSGSAAASVAASGAPASETESATAAAVKPAEPEPTLAELLAEARRAHRPEGGEGAGPPASRAAAHERAAERKD